MTNTNTPNANADHTPITKKRNTPIKETLCWTCEFSTGLTQPHPASQRKNHMFQCPWASAHEPVPGWTATPNNLKVSPTETTLSYCVEKCPYYTPDLEARIN